MKKKTKITHIPCSDFSGLWGHLQEFVKRQIGAKKWDGKSAKEAWEHLDFLLEFWEVCQTKPPTSWSDKK